MSPPPQHVPVLLERVLDILAPALTGAGAVCVDATTGLGGHSEALLQAHPGLRLVGLDRDAAALEISGRRLRGYGDRVHLVHAVYDELPRVLTELELGAVDGILFDLGVSSMQLDEPGRGFSYARTAPLDMRMDPELELTAGDIVNAYPVPDLIRVLRDFGEERFALRIARSIERHRRLAPLTTTTELAELVRAAVPAATRQTGGHPAKRTFQALRIEVNGELASVEAAIPAAIAALRVGGRLAVLSYHSLEDRIVKQRLAGMAVDRTPVDLPVPLPSAGPELRLLTRGAERASAAEIERNPRARSVRLRAAERIRLHNGSKATELKETA